MVASPALKTEVAGGRHSYRSYTRCQPVIRNRALVIAAPDCGWMAEFPVACRGGPDGRGGGRAGRQQLDVQGGGGMFRPRSVGGNSGAPKSNADFRALLGGKK